LSSSAARPGCEVIKRVENPPGLPHPVPAEAGELLEDAHFASLLLLQSWVARARS
jgi:hypothetical protein